MGMKKEDGGNEDVAEQDAMQTRWTEWRRRLMRTK